MNEKDFQDLITEIDNMTVEEYNKFHKESIKIKEESREILDELIREHSCRYARPSGLSNEEYESIDKYNHHEDKIENFLKSIPQIEFHLCLGGYIQDNNGIPCCHEDKVIYDENYEGILKWDRKNARFIITSIYGDYDFTQIKSFVKYN